VSKTRPLNIGIVGLGAMGAQHARNIIDGKVSGCRLAAVADCSAKVADKFPGIPFFNTIETMIDSGLVEAIVVATPHFFHSDAGIHALNRGLHVLMEKPLCVHKADAERLLAAHTSPQQVFAAMFNQRTQPSYRKLKELIDDGELGEIQRINWIVTDWYRSDAYYASGDWRATWGGEGGGVILNQCPHQLDLWQWLFGMPREVRAFCALGRYHDIEVEDDVTAYMRYANGATGVFITSTGEAPGTSRLEVSADKGRLVAENDSLVWHRNEVPVSVFTKENTDHFGKPPVEVIEFEVPGRGEQHVGILNNFVQAISEGTPLIAPAEEGINSVELSNAILYSGLKEQTVELPMDSGAYESFLQSLIKTSRFRSK